MDFTTLTYQVEFITPAFLGNSQQQAQWRTPPFKALLREWWRISQAKRLQYDVSKLRIAEQELFGHAAEDRLKNSGQSRVRLRLDKWEVGAPQTIKNSLREFTVSDGKYRTDVGTYLGYGPVDRSKNAIVQIDKVSLTISCESASASQIRLAGQLAHWFGTLGSRSHNGWGSISLTQEGAAQGLSKEGIESVWRNWQECLNLDWPHAIGIDGKGRPLIWQTQSDTNWKRVFGQLGQLRKNISKLNLPSVPGIPGRCILSYPVTKKVVPAWGYSGRITNQLRFKVFFMDGRYQGRVIHIPCRPPETMLPRNEPNRRLIIKTWSEVHQYLDGSQSNVRRLSDQAEASSMGGRQ